MHLGLESERDVLDKDLDGARVDPAFGDRDQVFAVASTFWFDTISGQLGKALALPTLRKAMTEMFVLTAPA